MILAVVVFDNEENANGVSSTYPCTPGQPGVNLAWIDMYEASVYIRICADQAEADAWIKTTLEVEEDLPVDEDRYNKLMDGIRPLEP